MKNRNKVKNTALKSRKGMTLTEVLVAMTLLVLIIFVFTPTFLSYFKNIRTAGELTKQTYERASLMERLVANKGGGNDIGYETAVSEVPLSLSAQGYGTVDFSTSTYGKVRGRLVSENLDRGDSYATFYTQSASNTMVCFPASLTDDFLTKDIVVVPKGFKFAEASFSKSATSGFHFEVYNTNAAGAQVKVDTKYYDISARDDGNSAKVAVFNFKGANNVISFENSPLHIKYCDDNGELYEVIVEINAPQIIMVGEKCSDGNYYYYVTKGVDPETGHMEVLAKKMTGDAALKSAMNDVEWVAEGRGDDGKGGVNKYGYFVMGGDAGQVRRFWRNETTGNYYWGGDNIVNYDSYSYINYEGGKNTVQSGAFETISPTLTTQAMYKKIFRSDQNIVSAAGVRVNEIFDGSKTSIISGNDYMAASTNYFTANVTNADSNRYFLTLGAVAKLRTLTSKYEYYGSDVDASKSEFSSLYSWLTGGQTMATSLNASGYKTATGYEYDDDSSLITITSVGAIQINKSNPTYYESQANTAYNSSVYPTKSYTLYCGYIPAVMDVMGLKTRAAIGGYTGWGHAATLGVAFSDRLNSWVPTGKMGDTHTTSTALSSSAFSDLSYVKLLNYCNNSTSNRDSLYPYHSKSNNNYWYKAGETTNGILAKGLAVQGEGSGYYFTSGNEVDITIGYLSNPFALSLDNPRAVLIEGLTGSDWYFKRHGDTSGTDKYDHEFFSAGLRDNVTMLDIKSFHDDITGNNISLAVGYAVSYLLSDHYYMTRLGQIYNTGLVYIRATGDGTEKDNAGDLSSGKGWSLKKETNVFHQFFGSDQYYGNDEGGFLGIGKDGTLAIRGWDTDKHRAYFNITSQQNKYPGDSGTKTPSNAVGTTGYGTNCHPLQQTECTTCNWGTTGDGKPQAMWGTDNGTMMSWFYNQENLSSSKITSVVKEFESYIWLKRIADVPKDDFYDYPSVSAKLSSKYGFISTLTRINDVCYADDIWVAVGNQSLDSSVSPNNLSKSGDSKFKPYTGNGEHASYVNVKYCVDRTNNVYLWKAVKIDDSDKVNILQVSYSEGIWYAMGYIDTNGNGRNDLDEKAVMYYSLNPTDSWNFCKTRTSATSETYVGNKNESVATAALTFDDTTGSFKSLGVYGVNSMASQG